MLTAIDLQRHTLRLYGELVARHESWAGKLVFAWGDGASATGLPAAVSIAGGTSLLLDPDAAAVKAVFRQGGVDFVVNTLDEALRVLKNQIRQHRPLGVGLIAEIAPVLAEMADRGVLPDLQIEITGPTAEPSQQQALQLQTDAEGGLVSSAEATAWLSRLGWEETLLSSAATRTPADPIRRNWIDRITRYQRDARATRLVWMTEKEQQKMALGT
jgi:hypothetical protein